MSKCEACGQPNGWSLVDPRMKYVCLPCTENDENVRLIGANYRHVDNWVEAVGGYRAALLGKTWNAQLLLEWQNFHKAPEKQ